MERQYFGTDGIRGAVGSGAITAEFFLKLGWSLGKVLGKQGHGHVLIGKDTRVSGYMFESALEAGLAASGFDTYLVGPMPTPAVAYLTRTLRAACGVVISASHNRYHDNGVKFFSAEGTKFPDEFELEIEKTLREPFSTVDSSLLGKAFRIDDAPGRYIEFCKSAFPNAKNLKGLKIVLDCANGATYHVAPNVFHELGAEVIVVHDEPDGFNINEQCGALHPETLRRLVLQEKADLGIALDGDGDRLIMVDEKGVVCDGDDLLYIIASRRYRRGKLTDGIVGTVMSNMGLEQAIKEMGLDFVRTPVGDRYVLEELTKRNWLLGGESSGHLICRYITTTGDGIVSALQVLAALCFEEKPLSELKAGFNKYPQMMKNILLPKRVDVLQQATVQEAIRNVEAELKGNGRVLVRLSGTEPLVRVMVEGRDQEQVNRCVEYLSECVAKVC